MTMSVIDAIYPFMGFMETIFFLTINNWRILFLFTTILHIFATYFILKYLTESPKWLYSKGKINESLEIIKKIADINGKNIEVETFLNLNKLELNSYNINDGKSKEEKNIDNNNNNFNIISILIKYPSQRLVIFILTFTYFVLLFVFMDYIKYRKYKREFS